MLLVSACLLGQNTRYDGRSSLEPGLMRELKGRAYVALCPELLGGMGVPRAPVEIIGGEPGREGELVLAGKARVVTLAGDDMTEAFVTGARLAARLALSAGVSRAWLKDRSPSCGWDPAGDNPGGGVGQGVLTALLLRAGVEVREVRAAAGEVMWA